MGQSQPLNNNQTVTLKDGMYHKQIENNHITVCGIPYKIPKVYLSTFIEVERGEVYLVDIDGNRKIKLEQAKAITTGVMRAGL